ncbi:MAG: radical SAM protein [Candidatus Gastranaerophilaceae bacterium]|jgi:MoaA/NifB/PqqE/SkfB family radical SAM enzyme
MPNIIISKKCNQNCPACFAKEDRHPEGEREMSFDNFIKVLDFLRANSEKNVRLIGGEPTTHSHFREIINLCIGDFNLHVFTNGLFNLKICNFLNEYQNKIKYSFNINPLEFYSEINKKIILRNLSLISLHKNSLLGAVVESENFDSSYLIKLAKMNNIELVVLRIANYKPGLKINHNTERIARTFINALRNIKKNGLNVGVGCGLKRENFNSVEIRFLHEVTKNTIKFGCGDNSGLFDIDINLDLFRCFPLRDEQKIKLDSFTKISDINKYFLQNLINKRCLN